MATINSNLQAHLDRNGITYTVPSNAIAQIGQVLSEQQMDQLMRVASVNGHRVTCTSGGVLQVILR